MKKDSHCFVQDLISQIPIYTMYEENVNNLVDYIGEYVTIIPTIWAVLTLINNSINHIKIYFYFCKFQLITNTSIVRNDIYIFTYFK